MKSDRRDEFDPRCKTPESWCCVDCGAATTNLAGKDTPVTDLRLTRFAIPCGRRLAWSRWAAASASAASRSVSAGTCGRRTLRAIHSMRGPDDGADIILMFPDGTAAEWHYFILMR
jgi:hypothetical protein